jgi:uncharacterized protein (TIGR03067 family)
VNTGLERIAGALRGSDESDAVLLDRFRHDRDECAFVELVGRHGRAVLAACRHVLTDPADIDDSFQAVFVVLFRKSAAVEARTLGSWLYAVAHRVAVRARADAARPQPGKAWPRRVERKAQNHRTLRGGRRSPSCTRSWTGCPTPTDWFCCTATSAGGPARKGRPIWAVRPARSRGAWNADAATSRLGWPGGASPAITLLASVTGNSAVAGSLPPNLIESTVHAVTGAASPSVTALVQGVLSMRTIVKMGLACVVLTAGLAGLGVILACSSEFPSSKGPASTDHVEPDKAAPVVPWAADKKPTDKERLQGRWQLVDADDSDGLTKKRGFARHIMVIEGDDLWTETPPGVPPGRAEDRGPFTIEAGETPKRIDFRTRGKDGENRLGIYSLDGEKLTICFSSVSPPRKELRPADFEIKPGTGRVLLEYEREKVAPAKGSVTAPAPKGPDPKTEVMYYPLKEKTAWVWEETIRGETTRTNVSVTKVERRDNDRLVTIETDKGGTGTLLVSGSGKSSGRLE